MPLNSPMEKEPEHWRILCERAAREDDLDKLVQLVREINRLLIRRLMREGKLPQGPQETFNSVGLGESRVPRTGEHSSKPQKLRGQ